MRAAVLFALALASGTAVAGPFSDVVKAPPRHAPAGTKAGFTRVSNVIYLNRCAGGCTVRPGRDDVHTNTSSIPPSQATLTEWPHGDAAWGSLVQCVKDLYAPFNIQVTDVDPGAADHFEVMVAGHAAALDMQGAGGVAPFIPCDGQLEDNIPSFVFAGDIADQDFLCWAAAQESAHVFGLDHELNAKDPMTYLSPPIKKPGFQNVDAKCGEDANDPRECWCGGTTQNSYQYLMDTFGPAQLEPATLSITTPADGAWVKPGFEIRAELQSQLSLTTSTLQLDDSTSTLTEKGKLAWVTSSTLPGGEHTLTLVATDTGDRTLSSQPITVHVTERCDGASSSCATGTHCLGGYCLPGPSVAGGLGAPCAGGSDCLTNTCASDGTDQLCVGACNSGSCPAGYDCIADGGAGVCWPGSTDGGGCSSSGTGTPWFALFGLGALVMISRRRR